MKKTIIIAVVLIVILGAVFAIRFLGGNEDTWICQNNEWVKHGNPSAPKPTEGCGSVIVEQPEIVVASPKTDQTITSPLVLEGKAKGSWFFEASAPVKLLDDKGNQIASGIIQAQGDWMTADYVPFKGQLDFSFGASANGTLVFNNDNPSGLPQNSKELKIPIKLVPTQTIKVKAYFNNNNLDPQISCDKTFPVEREIAKTQAVARAALEELLKGPTVAEKNQGYTTNINPGVKIQSLTIENGVAKVDFDEALEQSVGGSCRVSAIRSQITNTLKQFSTVKSVIISINGRTEDILQP